MGRPQGSRVRLESLTYLVPTMNPMYTRPQGGSREGCGLAFALVGCGRTLSNCCMPSPLRTWVRVFHDRFITYRPLRGPLVEVNSIPVDIPYRALLSLTRTDRRSETGTGAGAQLRGRTPEEVPTV